MLIEAFISHGKRANRTYIRGDKKRFNRLCLVVEHLEVAFVGHSGFRITRFKPPFLHLLVSLMSMQAPEQSEHTLEFKLYHFTPITTLLVFMGQQDRMEMSGSQDLRRPGH